jgi:hypothetical protein
MGETSQDRTARAVQKQKKINLRKIGGDIGRCEFYSKDILL